MNDVRFRHTILAKKGKTTKIMGTEAAVVVDADVEVAEGEVVELVIDEEVDDEDIDVDVDVDVGGEEVKLGSVISSIQVSSK